MAPDEKENFRTMAAAESPLKRARQPKPALIAFDSSLRVVFPRCFVVTPFDVLMFHPAEQKVFIKRPVVGDLDIEIRIGDWWDWIFIGDHLSKIGRRIL